MIRLNNKGFAVTTIVYGITILIVLLSFTTIKILRTTYTNEKDLIKDVSNELEDSLISKNIGISKSCSIDVIGCEVYIGDEHFYVIGDDENTSGNVKLLAKYLLNTTTNLQSESSYTTTSFADDAYWHDSNYDLISDYGSDYPAYIYDNNCNYYQYIEAYNDNLIDLYDIDSTARLLKYEEAVALGCDPEATEYYGSCDVDAINNNDLDWIYDYTYFTGTASYSTLVWYIVDGGSFYGQEIGKSNYGIRPVISVAKNIFDKGGVLN